MVTMGLSWILASAGVFVRDVGQSIGILTTALLFMTPIFYPTSALPEALRPYLFFNPLTFIIGQVREVILLGHAPAWGHLLSYTVKSLAVAYVGLYWFQKTRKGFADVL